MDRLEKRLLEGRLLKKMALMNYITHKMPELRIIDEHIYKVISQKVEIINVLEENCLTIQNQNLILTALQSTIDGLLRLDF